MKRKSLLISTLAVLAITSVGSQLVGAERSVGASSNAINNLIYATTNPTANNTGDSIVGIDKKLDGILSTFTDFSSVLSIQSIETDNSGRAFATFDNTAATSSAPATGGLIIISDVDNVSTTNRVVGSNTGIVSPKGVEIVAKNNVVIVSDVGSKSLRVFADDASGNVAPLFAVTNLGNATRTPWDADYDKSSDTLFVAGTDGVLLVYRNFFQTQGVNGPDTQITPAVNGVKASVNLHGVAYNSDNDTIVLSDVGSAAVATDGQLFVIANASTASGLTNVQARVSGADSRLGNPVDIDLKGGKLFVAEKSNNLILQFNNILEYQGDLNISADDNLVVTKPESVSVN